MCVTSVIHKKAEDVLFYNVPRIRFYKKRTKKEKRSDKKLKTPPHNKRDALTAAHTTPLFARVRTDSSKPKVVYLGRYHCFSIPSGGEGRRTAAFRSQDARDYETRFRFHSGLCDRGCAIGSY